ncbi:MAG: peptidase [Actinomycetota bacterium]
MLAVVFTTAVTVAQAAAAPAGSGSLGIRLLEDPAAGNDPRALLYIIDHVAPGSRIDRRVEVSNSTRSTAQVSMYASAATIVEGSFIGSEGRTANDLSTWTTVTPGTVALPANGKRMVDVSIRVPADAPPGEQYGVVWAEVSSDPGAGSITQVSRVGVRLYVSVGPGGAPAADFTIGSLTADRSPEGLPVVQASVENTGGRALDINGTLSLTNGPGGLSAGPFPAQLGNTLAPGDMQGVTFALGRDFPAGPWDAEVTVSSGLLERVSSATFTFPGVGAAVPASTPWWPYALGALVLLLLAGLLALLLRRRRT